jgi:flagellar basal body-associated protein FliL
MGFAFSKNINKQEQDIVSGDIQYCGTTSVNNTLNLNGAVLTTPPNCPGGGTIDISQASAVDSTCMLSALQNSTAEQVNELLAPSIAGLGFSSSINRNIADIAVKSYTQQKCADVSASDTINANGAIFDTCDLVITQNSNANTTCQINASQDLLSTVLTKEYASSEGASLLGGILLLLGALVFIIVVAIIALIVYKKMKNKGGESYGEVVESSGGMFGGLSNIFNDPNSFNNNLKKNKCLMVLIIIILLLIVVLIVALSKSNNKQITDQDFNTLGQKISDAQRIAGLTSEKFRNQAQYIPSNIRSNITSDNQSNYSMSDGYNSVNSPISSQRHLNSPNYNSFEEDNTLDDFYKPLLS